MENVEMLSIIRKIEQLLKKDSIDSARNLIKKKIENLKEV